MYSEVKRGAERERVGGERWAEEERQRERGGRRKRRSFKASSRSFA
jgi:hypothetical protein